MSASKKFLYGAFSLAILVALLYVGLTVFDRAIDVGRAITTEQEDTKKTVEEHAIVQYDGLKIQGATVISYIKTVVQKYHVPVEVTTPTNVFTCTDKSIFAEFRKIESDYYINPMKDYRVTVLRDVNDSINMVLIKYEP